MSGNQTDLLCEKHIDGFCGAKLLVECKLRSEGGVGVDEVNKFLNTARNLIAAGKITGAAIVTNTHFSKESRQVSADMPLVALKTIFELEGELYDFSNHYLASVLDYEQEEIFFTYVSAGAKIQKLALKDIGHTDALDDELFSRLTAEKSGLSLVLADFGGGKSTLLRAVCHRLAKRALKDPSSRRPVFIELKNFHQYTNMRDFFHSALPGDLPRSMSPARFEFLRSAGRFAFLLDGFDELRLADFAEERARTFLQIRQFIGDKSLLIISCRPTYFATERELKDALRDLVEPRKRFPVRLYGHASDRREKADQLLDTVGAPTPTPLTDRNLRVYAIDTFDEPRVKRYIERFIEREQSTIADDVGAIYEYLCSIYDISDLIRRPLLLYIILKMIEQHVLRLDERRGIGGAAEIYSLYVESCISRDHDKNVGRELFSTLERKRISHHLALLISALKVPRIIWAEIVASIAREAEHEDHLPSKIHTLGIDQVSADIRVCAFLRLDGENARRFTHKSVMEFFVAQHIYEHRQEFIEIKALRRHLSQEILFSYRNSSASIKRLGTEYPKAASFAR